MSNSCFILNKYSCSFKVVEKFLAKITHLSLLFNWNLLANLVEFTVQFNALKLPSSPGQFQFGRPSFPGFGQFDYEETTTPSPYPQPTSGNLTCYSCSLDFRSGYDNLNPCLGRHGEKVHPDYLVACGIRDIFCKVSHSMLHVMWD